ncbi:MAG: NTP transferase domain-containing protein [Kordiimonas sp.]
MMAQSGKFIAMIPARLGSQRLKQKNLQKINGIPLIAHAVRRCREAGVFDEIWVNTESDDIAEAAVAEGAQYHKRPENLADNNATSEQFVYEFLKAHECDVVFQVHSIAPLLTSSDIKRFVEQFATLNPNTMLSCIEDQIEVAYGGAPVNFTFDEKTNSQDLAPVQRITWSITAWRSEAYRAAYEAGKTATYTKPIAIHAVDAISGHVIKTSQDLEIADALLSLATK